MKTGFQKITSVVLIVLMLLTTVPQTVLSVFAENIDTVVGVSDDLYLNAKPIAVNISYTDNLSTSKETDYYSFSLSRSAAVRVNFKHELINSTSNYWVIKILDTSYRELLTFKSSGKAIDITGPSTGLASGNYYMTVGRDSYKNYDYTFSINTTYTEYWEKEYNNSFEEASSIQLNNSYSGSLMNTNDVDYYKFSTNISIGLSIEFSHQYIESTSIYWYFEIFTYDKQSIQEESITGKTEKKELSKVGLPAGTYYIKIYDSSWKSVDYSFTLKADANQFWEKEINNSMELSTDMILNADYHGSLGTINDIDYYKFSVQDNSVIWLDFSHEYFDNTSLLWGIYLYYYDNQTNSLNKILDFNSTGKTGIKSSSKVGLSSGDYYIKITDSNSYSRKEYSLRVSYEYAVDWESELNNTPDTGDHISFNTTYHGSICDTSDIDYYLFSLSEKANISVKFEHALIDDSIVYWYGALCDMAGKVKLSFSPVGKSTVSNKDVMLPKGDYYLKIRDGNSYNGSEYSFTISGPQSEPVNPDPQPDPATYRIRLYSQVPTLNVGKGKSIKAAAQLEKNGQAYSGSTSFAFVTGSGNIAQISNISYENGIVYFSINGLSNGKTKLTVTETNTNSIYSTDIEVSNGILTYNAKALPEYYDNASKYNGCIGGIYIDDFSSVANKAKSVYNVTFNAYNTMNFVGVVDIYNAKGDLIASKEIERFDDSFSSLTETVEKGLGMIGEIWRMAFKREGSYKQATISQHTPINIEVPFGGKIEVTNDPTYSETCAIYNAVEFHISSLFLLNDVFETVLKNKNKNETVKAISHNTSQNVVKRFISNLSSTLDGDTQAEKIREIGKDFVKTFAKESGKSISAANLKTEMASIVSNTEGVFNKSEVNYAEIINLSALNAGVSVGEGMLKEAMGTYGYILDGLFLVSQLGSHTVFYANMLKKHGTKAYRVYFNGNEGELCDNGVTARTISGTTNLGSSNIVMHSVIVSNGEDLSNQMKDTLKTLPQKHVVRDIYLEKDEKIVQPSEPIEVSIPIPVNYSKKKCMIYWVEEDGSLTLLTRQIVGNYLTFTTDHFSYYVLVDGSEGKLGDVNGDGAIDAIDRAKITRYVAKWKNSENDFDTTAADVNKDGKVNALDRIIITRYVAKCKGYESLPIVD